MPWELEMKCDVSRSDLFFIIAMNSIEWMLKVKFFLIHTGNTSLGCLCNIIIYTWVDNTSMLKESHASCQNILLFCGFVEKRRAKVMQYKSKKHVTGNILVHVVFLPSHSLHS